MTGDLSLGLIGQQQAAEAAVRIGEGGGDRVMAVEPDGALWRVARGTSGVVLLAFGHGGLTPRRTGEAVGGTGGTLRRLVAAWTRLEVAAGWPTFCGGLAGGTATILARSLWARSLWARSVWARASGARSV